MSSGPWVGWAAWDKAQDWRQRDTKEGIDLNLPEWQRDICILHEFLSVGVHYRGSFYKSGGQERMFCGCQPLDTLGFVQWAQIQSDTRDSRDGGSPDPSIMDLYLLLLA